MPTPDELYTEITNGSLKDELAPPWKSGDDTGVAVILNRADQSGYIPPLPLLKYLADVGLIAAFDLIRDHLLLPPANMSDPPTTPAPFGIYALASRLHHAIENGLRASVAEISAGCDVLVSVGLLAPEQKTAVLALETKISRAQTVWGLDVSISPNDIAAARKVGA